MTRRKSRRQRVALRFKRREHLKRRVHVVFVRGIAAALVIGFGAGLVTGGDSFVSRFVQRHSPEVTVSAQEALSGLPIQSDLPKNHIWLWFPGSERWLQRRVCRKYVAVRSVWLERHFSANVIRVHLESRLPLVMWNGSGFDQDGVLFAVAPGTWMVLPQGQFLETVNKRILGHWLGQLAGVPEIWSQVDSVKELPNETMELTFKTGTLVMWGTLESDPALRKAAVLLRVIDDAHKNLGGAATADLRFFDQGRIIVRPKGR